MDDKITQISLARAEARTDVRDAIAPFLSRCHLGEQRGAVIVGIRENGQVDIAAAVEAEDIDRMIGLLERVKLRLLEG